jgi:hypothetical protein
LCRKLGEKGRDKVTPVLFVDVPKVKIEICHRGLTGIAHGFDILDDCGARKCETTSVIFDGESQYSTNQRMVLPEPASQKIYCQAVSSREKEDGARFPCIQISEEELVDLHSL